jgi:hypothetical protein
MEDRYAQDLVKGASILLAEGAAYPISSVVTRAQSLYINPMVIEKPFSSFNAISSVLTAVPVHILKVKCASVFHSELTHKCKKLPQILSHQFKLQLRSQP